MELLLALMGLATGTYGVLVGSGGGIILGPLLLIFTDLETNVVAGTTLAMVALTSLSGSVVYRRIGVVDVRSGLLFAAAAIPGSVIAPFIVKNIAGDAFRALFGLLLLGLATYMIVGHRVNVFAPFGRPLARAWSATRAGQVRAADRHIETKSGERFDYRFNEPLATSFNFALGFVSAFFGTGGGFLRTPVLIAAFDFPVRVAVATSVFALSIYATIGAAVHWSIGNVEAYPTLVCTGAGLLVGSQIGARLSNVIPVAWILRALTAVLLAMGVRLVVQALA